MKLKQLSVITVINLDRLLGISQQWQFSILSSLNIFLNKKNHNQKYMPQIIGKKQRCFTVRFTKFLKTPFFIEHLRWLFLLLRRLLLYFFRKVIKQLFATLLWRSNKIFFSTHRLMYKKSNSFFYKLPSIFSFSKKLRQGVPYKAENWQAW